MAVFLRRDAHDLGKQPREIIAVVDAYHRADLIDFEVCRLQELAGTIHFESVEIVERRLPDAFTEDERELRDRVADVIAQLLFHTRNYVG